MKFARDIVEALEEKKAEDIVLLDIREITTLADFFVICTGGSDRTVRALVEVAEEVARKGHQVRGKVEGEPADGWMLVDFGDVVAHIFSKDQREYYRLEELWRQGKVLLRVQ